MLPEYDINNYNLEELKEQIHNSLAPTSVQSFLEGRRYRPDEIEELHLHLYICYELTDRQMRLQKGLYDLHKNCPACHQIRTRLIQEKENTPLPSSQP